MKRALFVGNLGTGYLFLLRLLTEEDSWEAKTTSLRMSKDFKLTVFYTADVEEGKDGEDGYVLHVNGEKLHHLGANTFYAKELATPESPQEMTGVRPLEMQMPTTQSTAAVLASKNQAHEERPEDKDL